MNSFRFCLLIFAICAITTPSGVAQVNTPEKLWISIASASATESSTLNSPRMACDANKAAEGPGEPPAQWQSDPPQSDPQPQADEQKTQREKAEQEIKEEEHQRVLGILPSFNVSYRDDAASLSSGQKMRLALHTSVDWATVAGAFGIAGYHEAANDLSGFSWGAKGYFERAGAAYLDAFDGTMIGNGVFPALLHQDPRYFRLGHGRVAHRLFYAVSTAVVCKHDNTGKWEPNYSNVAGNIASGAISNLYYPGSNSGIGLTISNGMIQTAEGAVGAVFQEFWPDVSRKLLHKDPTHGLDAQSATADGR